MLVPFHRRIVAGVAAGVLAIAAAGGVGYAAAAHGGPAGLVAQAAPTATSTAAPATTSPAQKPSGTGAFQRGGIKPVLDQLVSEGKLTQAQEDLIIQRLQAQASAHIGQGPRGFLGAASQSLATLFKISTTELQNDLRQGQSLHQIAQAHGVTDQQVSDTLMSSFKSRLDAAVANKRITAQQEQTMLTNFQNRLPQIINATPGKGFKGQGPRNRVGPRPTATPGATQ